MKWVLMLIFLILAVAGTAYAESGGKILKGDIPACLAEDLWEQMLAARGDKRLWDYLLDNGCFVPKKGLPISVLKHIDDNTVKIRIYVDDKAYLMWTHPTNILPF